ncbi:hypothetical protein CVT24_002703 [Panaeolus cyanescens]|uniref:Myb-like domain-containing protein n=1 Tax=Panaeolus cyanescens TaxID=181874 RepID=A0A409YYA3_9AGAR|nr:hypothetical protein CVT24_002703 [Panaeolus cyanescens]
MASMPSSSSSSSTLAAGTSTRSTTLSSPYLSFSINTNQHFPSQPLTTHDSSAQPNALKHRRVSLALPSSPRVVKTPAFRDEMALSDSSANPRTGASSNHNGSGNTSLKSKLGRTDDMNLQLSQDLYSTFDESEGDVGTEGDLEVGNGGDAEDLDFNEEDARVSVGMPEQSKKKRGRAKKPVNGDGILPPSAIASSSVTTTPVGVAPEKKPRKKWTEEETNELIKGCQKHGVGNWKTILQDKSLKFCDRTAVDLKDRFRTRFPDAYKDHYPNARTHLSSKVRSIQPDGTQLFTKMRNKKRRPFTPEEDAALKAGYEQHGTLWAVIARMTIFVLSGRKSTDLRDRFRNAYPDLYAAAGYKPRAYAGAGKEREKEREREREREKMIKEREDSEGADSASTPAASTGGTPGPPPSTRSSRRPSTSSVTSPVTKGTPTLLLAPGSSTPSTTTFSYKFRAVDDSTTVGPLSASASTSTFPQSTFLASSSTFGGASTSTSNSSMFPPTFVGAPSDGVAGPVRNRKRRHTSHGHLLRGGTKSVPQSAVCSEDEGGHNMLSAGGGGDGVFSDGEGPTSPITARNDKGKDRDRAVFKVPPLPMAKIKSQQGHAQASVTSGRLHIPPPEKGLQDGTQPQDGDSSGKLAGRIRGKPKSHRSHSLSPTKPSLGLQPLPEGTAVGPHGGISMDDTMTSSVNPYFLHTSFGFQRHGQNQTHREPRSPAEPSKAERDGVKQQGSESQSQSSRRDDDDSHSLGLGMSGLDLAMDMGGIDDLGLGPMMSMDLVSMDVDDQLSLGGMSGLGLGVGLGHGSMGMDLDHRESGRDVVMGGPEADADPLDIPEFYPNGAHVGMEGHWSANGKGKLAEEGGAETAGTQDKLKGSGNGRKARKDDTSVQTSSKKDESNGSLTINTGSNNAFGGTIGKSAWGAKDWLSPNPRLDPTSSSPSNLPLSMTSAFFSPQTHHSESGEDTDTDMDVQQDGDIDLEPRYDHDYDYDYEYDTSASVSANFSPASASISLSGLSGSLSISASASASASVSPLSSFNTLNHGVMDRYDLLAPSTSLHGTYSSAEFSSAMSDVGVGSSSDLYGHHSHHGHHGFGNHYSSIGSLLSGTYSGYHGSSASAVGASSGSGAQGYSGAYPSTVFGYGYNGAPVPGHYSQIAGDLISGRGGWGVGLGLVGLGLGSWEGGSAASGEVGGSGGAGEGSSGNATSTHSRRHGQAHTHTPSLTAINELSMSSVAVDENHGQRNGVEKVGGSVGEGGSSQGQTPDNAQNLADSESPRKNTRGRKTERQLQGTPFLVSTSNAAGPSSHPSNATGRPPITPSSDPSSSKASHSLSMGSISDTKFEMSDLVDMTRVENLDAGVGSGSILVDAQQPHVVEGSRTRDASVDQDRHDQHHQQPELQRAGKDDSEQHATPPATPLMRQPRPIPTGTRRASQGAASGLQSGFMAGFGLSSTSGNGALVQPFNGVGGSHFVGQAGYGFEEGGIIGGQANMSQHARSVSVPPSEARNSSNVDPGVLFGSSFDDVSLNGYSQNGYSFAHSQHSGATPSFFNVAPSQLSSSSTLADALSPPRAMSHSNSSSSILSSTSSSSSSGTSSIVAAGRRRHHHRASSASMYSVRTGDDVSFRHDHPQVQHTHTAEGRRNLQSQDSQNMLTPLFNSRLILSPDSPSALSPTTPLNSQSSESEAHDDQQQHNPTTPRRTHNRLSSENLETPHADLNDADSSSWRPSTSSGLPSSQPQHNFSSHGFSSGELSNVPYLDLHYFNNSFSHHGYAHGAGTGTNLGASDAQTFTSAAVLGFEALDPAKSWQGLALDLAHRTGIANNNHAFNALQNNFAGTSISPQIGSYLPYQPTPQSSGVVNPANLTSSPPTSALKTVRQRHHVRPSLPLSMQIPKNLTSDGFLSPTHNASRHNPLNSGGPSGNSNLAETLASMKDSPVLTASMGSPPSKNSTVRQGHGKLRSSSRSVSSGGFSLSRSGASTPVPGNTGGGANLTRSLSHHRGQSTASSSPGSHPRSSGPAGICPQDLVLPSSLGDNKRKRASWDGGLV